MCEPCIDLGEPSKRLRVCTAVGYIPLAIEEVGAETLGVSGPEDLSYEELYDMTSTYMFAETILVPPSSELREAAAESAADLYHLNK